MAHILKLGALTDELITLLTSTSAKSDPTKFNIYKESALRGLRYHNHSRTNQFDVSNRLEGLEEKLRIYNEDPLADALRERLDVLERKKLRWGPEILHLLLELSDKPVSKSKLSDLDSLREPDQAVGPPLRWKDVIAEDVLRDKIWRTVDFGAESSENEDGYDDSRSEQSGTDETTHSSIDDDFHPRPDEYTVDTTNTEGLAKLRQAQFWKKTPSVGGIKLETVKKSVTELQAVREVLFMLSGYPTSLFDTESEISTSIIPSTVFTMYHASSEAFQKLLQAFADDGSSVAILRFWVKRAQSIPLVQIFQSAISQRLESFDTLLSDLQHNLVAIEEDVVVSLLKVRCEVDGSLRELILLANIIRQLEQERYPHAFRYLEILYDKTCTSQMAGDETMYVFMAKLFFQCFQVYLRPLRSWMEEGDLTSGDNVFFVTETAGDVGPASMWQNRYKIRQTQSGALHAPRFLHAAVNKIFTTGKSVVILKELNKFEYLHSYKDDFKNFLGNEICDLSRQQLAPFSALFDVAFDQWVQGKHHFASSRLRETLFESCGLQTSLDAVSRLYFMSHGTATAAFTNSVFDKLDTLDESWNDRFSLTELAQSSFNSVPAINIDQIRTHVLRLPRKVKDIVNCRRSVKVLAAIELRYRLSWPVQIILTPVTLSSYQRVFTFLFQIRRSSHILSRRRLIDDDLTHTSSPDERALYYSLRTRLIWFTKTLFNYLTSLVLVPNSHRMREQLKNSEDVDAMIEVHTTFIKAITDQALLGSKLDLIHETILKMLDLSIKLEDAQAANADASKKASEQQQEMMDRSMASLGLQTPQKRPSRPPPKVEEENTSEEDEEIDVDLSVLSHSYDDRGEKSYVEKLMQMKADFDRLGRFVASGLRGVARAARGDEARSWDVLGDMLESGFDGGSLGF